MVKSVATNFAQNAEQLETKTPKAGRFEDRA